MPAVGGLKPAGLDPRLRGERGLASASRMRAPAKKRSKPVEFRPAFRKTSPAISTDREKTPVGFAPTFPHPLQLRRHSPPHVAERDHLPAVRPHPTAAVVLPPPRPRARRRHPLPQGRRDLLLAVRDPDSPRLVRGRPR